MNVFNFRKANLWFKAIDLLKVDLTKDPLLKHYHPEGWHPPKPCPPRRQYAPTKDIIGQTPEGDQTWSVKQSCVKSNTFFTLFFRVDPPTFYPTLEEFSNLTKYVEYMESQGAHRYNFCTHFITRRKISSGRWKLPRERPNQLHRPILSRKVNFSVHQSLTWGKLAQGILDL